MKMVKYNRETDPIVKKAKMYMKRIDTACKRSNIRLTRTDILNRKGYFNVGDDLLVVNFDISIDKSLLHKKYNLPYTSHRSDWFDAASDYVTNKVIHAVSRPDSGMQDDDYIMGETIVKIQHVMNVYR